MARRKRKEEEADWVAPDFDEGEYMRREVRGTQAAVATILWAIVGAIVAFLLYSVLPALAFFAGIAVGFGLFFILPLFGIKTDAFKRRDWAGHGITYFFSWLAFWIILLNPPFGDFTDPTIQGIAVSPYTVGYLGDLPCLVPVDGQRRVTMSSNTSLYVLFRATDNSGLDSLQVNVTPAGKTGFDAAWNLLSGKSQCVLHRLEDYPAGSYNVTFPYFGESSFRVVIVATDRVGRQATASFVILPQ